MADVLSRIDPRLCVQCKASRGLCGIDPCPLLQRVRHHLPTVVPKMRDIFGSSPPAMFVGRHGYPRVGVGPMLPPEHLDEDAARRLDDPATWLDTMTIPDVVGLRSSLLRTRHSVRVDQAAMRPDRITNVAQELAMAARPADAEVRLDKVPRFDAMHVGDFTVPHGPTAGIERAVLAENPRIERPVQRTVDDTDLRAGAAMAELSAAGVDGYRLERILSAGLLGMGKRRRLVPTRWAITATDDILAGDLRDKVRGNTTIDKPTIHSTARFGNRFHVLLLPRVWSFELVEMWGKGSFWALAGPPPSDAGPVHVVAAADHEGPEGRSAYAAATAGGYYAARLPVLEHLASIRRQATAIVVREITAEYTTPLGVWVVRETMRRAMSTKPLVFEDVPAALRHIDRRAMAPWQPHAEMLRHVQTQRTLDSY